jgi:hypothetical protein
MVENICRPDNNHWCVACCKERNNGRPCLLLGELEDGTEGCLGYKGSVTLSGLTQLQSCQDAPICNSLPDDIKARVFDCVKELPRGRFDIREVLDQC